MAPTEAPGDKTAGAAESELGMTEEPCPLEGNDTDAEEEDVQPSYTIELTQSGMRSGHIDLDTSKVFAAVLGNMARIPEADLTPTFMPLSKKGPYVFITDKDTWSKYKARFGECNLLPIDGTTYHLNARYGHVDDNQVSGNPKASLKAVAAHIVYQCFETKLVNHIKMRELRKAVEKAGLTFISGNREKQKMHSAQGYVSTDSYIPKWHIYVVPKSGAANEFKWPRFLDLYINGVLVRIKYILRVCDVLPAGTICGEPNGCKLYKGPKAGHDPCKCDPNDIAITQARANNKKKQRLAFDVRAALGSEVKPPVCSKFALGLCKHNRRGKFCASEHPSAHYDILGKCTVMCAFPANRKYAGECALGRECLYLHPPKDAME